MKIRTITGDIDLPLIYTPDKPNSSNAEYFWTPFNDYMDMIQISIVYKDQNGVVAIQQMDMTGFVAGSGVNVFVEKRNS